jgi:hypothetical protein
MKKTKTDYSLYLQGLYCQSYGFLFDINILKTNSGGCIATVPGWFTLSVTVCCVF